MTDEEKIKALELKLADIKRQITRYEGVLQSKWLDLIEVQAELATARHGRADTPDHDYDPEATAARRCK
jgi:hypothetical protein